MGRRAIRGGGTASITSVEGARKLRELFDRDEDAWMRQNEVITTR
jgi:hypothetical protein